MGQDGSQLDAMMLSVLRTPIANDENLHAALRRVALAGCDLLRDCAAASVTLIARGRPTTVGSSSEIATALDQAQYDAGRGPCLTAAVEGHIVRVDDVAKEGRWPEFRRVALAHDLHSSLSTPMTVPGQALGGFNVYGRAVGSFDEADQQLAAEFAEHASVVVSNAQSYWAALDATRHLTIALENRAVIERAKGVLIARHGYGDDEAFDALRRRSQDENRKLRDVAAAIVDDAQWRRQ